MKKFILKTLWFLPIILLHVFTTMCYNTSKGDLLRLGYIVDLYPNYRDDFKEEFQRKLNFDKFSKMPKSNAYSILTVGDSFSNQGAFGYQNYMDTEKTGTILHLDKIPKYGNQIQNLYSLINGGFFDEFKFKYVILQNVERDFVNRALRLDSTLKTSKTDLDSLIKTKHNDTDILTSKFISRADLVVPFYTFKYIQNKDVIFNEEVYKTELSNSYFSVSKNDLLFYISDLTNTPINNKPENIDYLNTILNRIDAILKKKGVTLIVLPSPNKYTIYYPYILDKTNYSKPLFFEKFAGLKKNYLYIDTKKVLSKAVLEKKDIYFYDDTHWSPKASKIIAKEIENVMSVDKEKNLSTTNSQ